MKKIPSGILGFDVFEIRNLFFHGSSVYWKEKKDKAN